MSETALLSATIPADAFNATATSSHKETVPPDPSTTKT